ncbi:ATP-binding cassette domain-containing protein, partial [Mesorhizobium sp.]
PPLSEPGSETLLEVENLSSPERSFQNVSFSVRTGEILGIAGLIGAGRTELVRAIAGADPISSGSVRVAGKPVHLNGPAAAIKAGVVLVPEDRKAQGVVLDQT